MNEAVELVPGRSTGDVDVPAVRPDLPVITDSEVNAALDELGLTGLRASQIKAFRELGQSMRATGVVSVGRGILVLTTGQLIKLATEINEDQEDVEPELKHKQRILRKDVADSLTGIAKTILESEDTDHKELPTKTTRLPLAREQLIHPSLTQQNVHVHLNA